MPTECGFRRLVPRWPSTVSRRLLLGAVALAAVLQTWLVLTSPVIGKDGIRFIGIARELTADPGAVVRRADQHPGYPVMVLAGRWLLGGLAGGNEIDSWVLGARVFPWLGGLLTVVLVWLIARQALGEEVAGIAAILFAAFPLFRWNAADAMSDTPCLALYLTAVWFLIEGMTRKRILYFVAVGFTSALAYLVRPEGLSVFVAACGFLVAMLLRREDRWFAALVLLVVVLVAALGAVPYIAAKGALTGKKDVLSLFRGWTEEGGSALGEERASVPARAVQCAGEMADVFVEDGLRYVLAVPLLAGLFMPGRRRSVRASRRVVQALVGLHLGLLVLLFFTAGYMCHRHVMVPSVLAMPWIALGMVVLGEAGERVLRRTRFASCRLTGYRLAVIGVLIAALAFLPRTLRPLYAKRVPLVEAGRWVNARTGPGDRVLTNSRHAFFHSDRAGLLLEEPIDHLAELDAEEPPYAVIVFDGHQWGPGGPLLEQAAKRYEETIVPGISGGPRQVIILQRRP
jgi:4-amino-4-deoxy-L-arabinose transferase-like glycosyltransferase